MTRTVLAALCVLLFAPLAKAQPLAALAAHPLASDGAIDAHARDVGEAGAVDEADAEDPAERYADDEDTEEADAEEYGDDEGSDELVEFCGGGEESVVDEAFYALEADRPAEARRMLVEALRAGWVEEWQRGPALVTLAEAQLRSGQPGAAALNYQKALLVHGDEVGVEARVGLATALLLRGRPRLAHREALTARESACAERWSQAACYAAQRVIARSSGAAPERASADEAAAALRATRADLAETFDAIDARLDPARSGG